MIRARRNGGAGKIPPGIVELKNICYHCKRCGEWVVEYNNIGQWKCQMIRSNPYSSTKYAVAADHGPVDKKPEMLFSVNAAFHLPPISNSNAVEIRQLIGVGGLPANEKVVAVYRYCPRLKPYSSKFLKI